MSPIQTGLDPAAANRITPRDPGESGGLWPALALLGVGLVALTGATLFSDTAPGQYVVIAPPGSQSNDAMAIVVAADGALVAQGGFAPVIVAASTDPEFPARLRAAGAWAVFPAPRFLGCEPPADWSQI